jgi:hypothetical protein
MDFLLCIKIGEHRFLDFVGFENHEETPRRRIKVTSSLNEISTDKL